MSNHFADDPAFIEKLRKMHPFSLFLYIAMLGMGILFLFLIVSFWLSGPFQLPILPRSFILSTIVLLISSLFMYKAKYSYGLDSMQPLVQNLAICILLGQLFIFFQFKGWNELQTHHVSFFGKAYESYPYLLSGLHLAHFLGGMVFLIIQFFKVFVYSKDEVKALIYSTDPFQKLLLNLLHTYWQFMDIVWLIIFFVMLALL